VDLDKRLSERKVLRVKAILTMDGAVPMLVRTMDIGKYGMCVINIPQALKTSLEVEVRFEVVFGGKIENVTITARVSYCVHSEEEGYRAGLQFLNPASPGAALIAQYIAS